MHLRFFLSLGGRTMIMQSTLLCPDFLCNSALCGLSNLDLGSIGAWQTLRERQRNFLRRLEEVDF